ncbi:rod-binding protein [Vibrio sp. YIC-376]|uniref:rod-binding protein n=1 Tax=Vibrio sp. YIC-376 TaxID=3136162 RepID=UPI00402A6F4A
MNLEGLNEQSSVLYHDNNTLKQIKQNNQQGEALEVVAEQFEAMFLQMVLRQMRSSSDVLADDDSPFASQQQGVFRDMYDGQLAINMAQKQRSGIADMLVQQLGTSDNGVTSETRGNILAANDSRLTFVDTEEGSTDASTNLNRKIHLSSEMVASVKQAQQEVHSTAFAQPLIRKREL